MPRFEVAQRTEVATRLSMASNHSSLHRGHQRYLSHLFAVLAAGLSLWLGSGCNEEFERPRAPAGPTIFEAFGAPTVDITPENLNEATRLVAIAATFVDYERELLNLVLGQLLSNDESVEPQEKVQKYSLGVDGYFVAERACSPSGTLEFRGRFDFDGLETRLWGSARNCIDDLVSDELALDGEITIDLSRRLRGPDDLLDLQIGVRVEGSLTVSGQTLENPVILLEPDASWQVLIPLDSGELIGIVSEPGLSIVGTNGVADCVEDGEGYVCGELP